MIRSAAPNVIARRSKTTCYVHLAINILRTQKCNQTYALMKLIAHTMCIHILFRQRHKIASFDQLV